MDFIKKNWLLIAAALMAYMYYTKTGLFAPKTAQPTGKSENWLTRFRTFGTDTFNGNTGINPPTNGETIHHTPPPPNYTNPIATDPNAPIAPFTVKNIKRNTPFLSI